MPISKGNNGKYYVKIWMDKECYTPAKMGMGQTSWPTKTEAKAAEVELRRLVKAQSSTIQTTLDLLTLCNRYLKDQQEKVVGHDTFSKKIRFCKEIIARWGKTTPIADIKVYMVQEYLNERAKQFTANSFNTYRKEGVALFNWAINQQLLAADTINVFSRVKKLPHSTGGPKPAPVNDVLKVLAVANQDQRDLIMCYLLTGARKNEILTMTWDDVDLQKRTYKLHTLKTGNKLPKTTVHAMPDQLCEILTRKHENRNPGLKYVFWHRFYSQPQKAYVEDRYMSLNKFTMRLCKKAGVTLFGLHQLRHLAATLLAHGNMSTIQAKQFLRHDHITTTELYMGTLDNSTAEQSNYLDKFWSEKLAETADAQ